MRVVADAGPIIHLDELDCIGLLDDFGEILVPSVVWAEVSRHRPSALGRICRSGRSARPSRPTPRPGRVSRALNLHVGEREALCIALEHQAGLVLTDDTAARVG